jgi:hypothetical protein
MRRKGGHDLQQQKEVRFCFLTPIINIYKSFRGMKICTYILRRGPREGDESNRKTTQVEEDRESQHFS